MKKNHLFLSFFLMFILFFSCSSKKKSDYPFFQKINKKNYPSFHDDMGCDGLLNAVNNSLEYYKKFNRDKEFVFGLKKIKKEDIENAFIKFASFLEKNPQEKELKLYIKKNFDVYVPVSYKNKKNILFTGYYEPELFGSLVKTSKFSCPAYLLPENILYVELGKFSKKYGKKKLIARKEGKKIIPYFTNEEIAFENVLKEEGKVLVWLKNRVALFFLQIQGSGKILLQNGDVMRVHYAGTNGHSYKSIGKYLIDNNKMSRENMSMQNLKKYLMNNPQEEREILSYNSSYVFFEEVEGGPFGALSQELTQGRSLACDLSIYPRGGLVYVQAKKPVMSEENEIKEWEDLERFMLVQDTGGAIKGYFRGDIFFGWGKYAETAAGKLAEKGKIFVLVPAQTKTPER